MIVPEVEVDRKTLHFKDSKGWHLEAKLGCVAATLLLTLAQEHRIQARWQTRELETPNLFKEALFSHLRLRLVSRVDLGSEADLRAAKMKHWNFLNELFDHPLRIPIWILLDRAII